jgi:predicted RNA-binding Zn-ribbon protein involved in translation (DUF1610 family)
MVDFDPTIYPLPPAPYGGHEWARDRTGAFVCKHCDLSAYGESKPCTAHHWLAPDIGNGATCTRCGIKNCEQGSGKPCPRAFPRLSDRPAQEPQRGGPVHISTAIAEAEARYRQKEAEATAITIQAQPIAMLLWCPECGQRHIDEGDFAHKPHHTHACQNCGLNWRPAVVATVGVRFLPGFKNVTASNSETLQ